MSDWKPSSGASGASSWEPNSNLVTGIDKTFIAPEIESFFVAVAMQLGIGPEKLFPPESFALRRVLSDKLMNHPGRPPEFAKIIRAHMEFGGKFLSQGREHAVGSQNDKQWFWDNMADSMILYLRRQYPNHRPIDNTHD